MSSKRNTEESSAAPAEPSKQSFLGALRYQSRSPSPGPIPEGHKAPTEKSRKRDKFLRVFRSRSRSQNNFAKPNPEVEPATQPEDKLAFGNDGNPPAKQYDNQGNRPTKPEEQQKSTSTSKCNDQGVSNGLWVKALENIPAEQKRVLEKAGIKSETLSGKRELLEELLKTAKVAHARCEAKRWKLKWGEKEIDVREKAEAIIGWIEKFKHVGDLAIQADQVHAALPWAGVRFLLTILISGEQNMAAAVVGAERVTMLVSHCAVYEQLYLTSEVVPTAETATQNLRRTLLDLYTAILVFLSLLMELFSNSFGKGILEDIKNPGKVLDKMKLLDKPESALHTAADMVEKCYHMNTRNINNEEFNALKALLKDFKPSIGKIDFTITAMFKSIEKSERIKILKWFSKIPYQSHHDLAQEGRVEGTGNWLFGRAEFNNWWQAENSEILWLHGIPGAGKTKLMSAVIDHLQTKADKVAFFYCKRDEQDRRSRDKILLSFVKQLASPSSETICKPAMEAYQQQQDPSARKQMPTAMSLKLIINLLECYQQPVIMLDALDECPEDVRGSILEDIVSIMNSNRPIKVLVSSRICLDIQESLKDVPHVCIEACDNAEDIKAYVETELDRSIKSKQLLRGRVSAGLRDRIQQVLLRDAHGMFLWVSYQLQQLCTFRLEEDVHDRLGKLPKGLSGVYDEILTTIKSQEGSGSLWAERALKWMLVSCRPLKPQEIIAASALDSRIPLNADIRESKSQVEVDVVLDFCRGLLIWDRRLNVIRFAHLSVNEYLERKGHEWDIIDAQLHVAEACLWTLQDPRNLERSNKEIALFSPLYPYSAMFWFRHCRSYQDMVMSHSKSVAASQYALEIPLLNSFLSSFDNATRSYTRWVDSLDTYRKAPTSIIARVVKSAPLQPAFAAGLGGLGQLISWLWQSENTDMGVRNLEETPLLEVVLKHGQNKWIAELIVQNGGDVNWKGTRYGSALIAAVEHEGDLELVSLLLERGADVNAASEFSETALTAAVRKGHLALVSLLLDRGADANFLGRKMYNDTALTIAALAANLEVVSLLLQRGADVNLVAGECGTALATAVCSGRMEVISLLLEQGANVNLIGHYNPTALMFGIQKRSLEVVSLLLEWGADVNLVAGEHGTALAVASREWDLELASLLLERGADINLVGGKSGTALTAAASVGGLEVASLLLERGADINLVGGKYGTALVAAAGAWNQSLELVSLLLERGADINFVGGEYGTALTAAASKGDLKVASLLLERGADINTVGGKYGTALTAAAYEGNLNIVSLLLDRGADINLVGGEYGGALAAAKRRKESQVVSLLLKRGATEIEA